jgi:Pro-kumamolisin, activation domain/Bacterial Ig-like domain (group 3)
MNAMKQIYLGILVFVTSVPALGQRPAIVEPAALGPTTPPQESTRGPQDRDKARITQMIDDTETVRIVRTTHPLAALANDRGRVEADLSMKRIVLLLKPSEKQQGALKKLIDNQHDPESSNYQRWLTPEQYAAQFGPDQNDLDVITSWLQQHGFSIDSVARGKQWVEFSGTASQVESTFHTEMHRYVMNGETHIANATDISLPQALVPVVRGLLSLHDFRLRPLHRKAFQVQRDSATGKLIPVSPANPGRSGQPQTNPEFTPAGIPDPGHFLAPGDWSKIYNTAPLLENNVTGSGISIAIVGSDSDIQLSDVRTFRQIFKLPARDPVFLVNGLDPGVNVWSDAEVEADLDVEWSGAIAPDATIKFVTSSSTPATSGAFLSISYIVDNRLAPIMSVSFGACEAFLGPGGNAFLNSAYEQAAAEGISVFVASGDTGAAGCDSQISFSPAAFGPNVSGFASTPYNVAVGGTMFAENGRDAVYWDANNRADFSSAVGYIPETVWDEPCDPTIDANQCSGTLAYFLSAGSGGPSSCTQSVFQSDGTILCEGGYPKPSWQSSKGVPMDGARDIPDVSLTAGAGHDGYLVCVEGTCQSTTSSGHTTLHSAYVVGGTSAGAPSMAGLMALIEQKTGAYQGLVNYDLYKLAAADQPATCNSTLLLDPNQSSDCTFYDVTSGNSDVPGQLGYEATTGYDLATGLGSVNAARLLNRWHTMAKLRTATELSTNTERIAIRHGQPIPLNVAVKPVSGAGEPDGDFSLATDNSTWTLGGTLANGRFAGNVTGVPGGVRTITARYGGDAMFAASLSNPVKVRVTPEESVVSVQPLEINFIGAVSPVTGPLVYGQPFGLQVDVQGKSGVGSPTGNLTVQMDSGPSLGTFPINQSGSAFVELDGLGSVVPDALRSTGLTVGLHTFKVVYTGDDSFNPSTPSPVSVSVKKVESQTLIIPVQNVYTAGIPIDFIFLVGDEGIQDPTGTVRLYDCGLDPTNHCLLGVPISEPIALKTTGPLGGPGTAGAQATYRASLSAGTHSLKLAYSGDSNYQPVALGTHFSFPAKITVNPLAQMRSNIKIRQSPGTITVGQSESYLVSVTPSQAQGSRPTGTVTLFDMFGNALAGPASLSESNASFTLPWNQAGEQLVFASYSGDANYGPLNSPIVTTVVNPAQTTVILSSSSTENSPSILTVTVAGLVFDPNISAPAAEGGQVEFLDSVNGGAPQILGSGPQPLTTANGGSSIRIFSVMLPDGENAITARFLGTPDWKPGVSNPVVVSVRKGKSPRDSED